VARLDAARPTCILRNPAMRRRGDKVL